MATALDAPQIGTQAEQLPTVALDAPQIEVRPSEGGSFGSREASWWSTGRVVQRFFARLSSP